MGWIHTVDDKHVALYLLNILQNIVKPLEGGSAVAQPHGSPEVDRIEHQVSHTHVKLVGHCEPLLGPDKVPLVFTDKLEELPQHKVSRAIATYIDEQIDRYRRMADNHEASRQIDR